MSTGWPRLFPNKYFSVKSTPSTAGLIPKVQSKDILVQTKTGTHESLRGRKTGDIYVEPLACESLGIRSLATYIETPDLTAILDPGLSHGTRTLLPHPKEEKALVDCGNRILGRAASTEILTISHYHFDHYMPTFTHWRNYSSKHACDELYQGKEILLKSPHQAIDDRQKGRAQHLLERKDCNLRTADGELFRYGKTKLKFSEPLPHGVENSSLGTVLIAAIATPKTTMVFAPDVQGPMVDSTLDYILKQGPDLVVIGGPPTYLRHKVPEESLQNGLSNLGLLAENVPCTVVDHHLLRDRNWEALLENPREIAKQKGHQMVCGAEFLGVEPTPLEAQREHLWETWPPEENWKYQLTST